MIPCYYYVFYHYICILNDNHHMLLVSLVFIIRILGLTAPSLWDSTVYREYQISLRLTYAGAVNAIFGLSQFPHESKRISFRIGHWERV